MLEDSSFAIHPDLQGQSGAQKLNRIGAAAGFTPIGNGISIQTESGDLIVAFSREDIVRITINFQGETARGTSPAIIPNSRSVEFIVEETEAAYQVRSKLLAVFVEKDPISITVKDSEDRTLLQDAELGMGYSEGGGVFCQKTLHPDDHFYGFGEKTGFLDKRGEKLAMWNTDVFAPHNPETDPLYQSIPFFMVLRDGKATGIYFDNTFKSFFDLGSNNETFSFGAEGGQLDYYVMAGSGPKSVVEQYTFLTGRMPIPPKWALGYHQSRYSYANEEEVMDVVRLFDEKDIPLDAIYLDIHYMDGYRVFTYDQEAFPHFAEMIGALKEKGIQVVPIVDPGVKMDPEYGVYQDGVIQDYFCKYPTDEIYYGEVWPGQSAFPDFTETSVRNWWGDLHNFYAEKGIEGIWNDMNEPAVFNESKTMDLFVIHKNDGSPKTHQELHNLYGLLMAEATVDGMKKLLKGKRTFLLTRAGFSGIQRYAAVWTGDNRSFWEHLQMSLPMLMNLGLSGVPFSGTDVGGFAHDSNGELLTRWTQAGVLTPYFRNHSVLGSARQEPWSFGEKYEKIINKYITLRYEWLPQLYTLFHEAHKSGLPVMRALLMEYPEDSMTWNLSDQFMLGENVIVAPVMQPGAVCRAVYLPEGSWVNYWDNETYEGGRHHLVQSELDTLPIFVKQGTAIALTEGKLTTAVPDQKLLLHLYYKDGSESDLSLYEDDGSTYAYEEGQWLNRQYNFVQNKEEIIISVKDSGKFSPSWKEVQLIVHGGGTELKLQIEGQVKHPTKKTSKTTTFIL